MPKPEPSAARVVVIGGGTAGICVAARLRRAGLDGVCVLEPSPVHWYQPLWTLVGGGEAPLSASRRPQSSVTPRGVRWVRDRAVSVDPEERTVLTGDGQQLPYDALVLAPGVQLNWDRIPGLAQALGREAVSSNYDPEHAGHTWELIRAARSGTAVFTMPAGPVKCAGAPQKIAYLAADYWRKQGVLGDMRVILVLPTASIFSQPQWAAVLEGVAARYGIEVRYSSELVAVDGARREATIRDNAAGTSEVVGYDLMHATPPQSAPSWLAGGPLADPASPYGYAKVDKHTLRSPDFPQVFALGDAANLPTSKTGAAVRKQAPVAAANLLDALHGRQPSARYDGYTSCPLVTARHKMLLAEFDYELTARPSLPFIDTFRERTDMWLLKRYGLPALYWRLMLRGLA
ncbi:NAD(P)/FAD-dependent oxidoreductase [Actinocrinis puniceicyclus]|uniref:NAD(P)/FAD-dependent oxidoreductase n=1 Tax=Actinocrinis puniceicyclus TaxID=977794 RepID=A0A8J7WP27_9ACTN|nr:FAD/NAD(P)-binding oxidoreductase [Actinocrinis puniceicyclus]MBS2965953.1 NAD(P)/FAD-dependent oxidoreductase [Actinocrinis puniceicyclus]